MRGILVLLDLAIHVYIWIVFAFAIALLTIAFYAASIRNTAVAISLRMLGAVTEPLLRPIRAVLPDTGQVDVSPVVLILLLVVLRYIIALYVMRVFG